MATLICGSLAFDNLMTFEGRFADQIQPARLPRMGLSLLVPTLKREFGGCAGNIAYTLQALGGTPLPMATIGQDGADYVTRLQHLGISTRWVREVPDTHTGQAMIITDRDGNQVTAFHPGAMMQAHVNHVPADGSVQLGIVSPDGRDAMLQHAEEFHAAGIPFVFDPGQGLPMFDGAALAHFVELATWVTVNENEGALLCERTGRTPQELSRGLRGGFIVTLSAKGCDLWRDGARTHVDGVPVAQPVDPTGCGDAWRGALLYGLERGWPLTRCAALGNRVGAIKVAAQGPQNYTLDAPALLAAVADIA